MTLDAEFLDAVRRLHRAKDAAYRDAWKRRGEVLSILANIARKVDRLEYGMAGAPVTADESGVDTAVDLLVYCLKYQAYLADLDPEAAARLFGGGGIRPPYSDGTSGFEALLAEADLAPAWVNESSVAEAARCIVSRFAELEACFCQTAGIEAVSVRLARLIMLTDAAAVLVGAFRREHAHAYARFMDTCRALKQGGAADAR